MGCFDKILRAFHFFVIITKERLEIMTIKQKNMLQNHAKLNGFSFSDNLKIGEQTIKLNEIELYEIPYQNEIINKIMNKQYKIDYTEKIEKLKEQQKIKKQQNRIKLLFSQIKNYQWFINHGQPKHKKTWLKYEKIAKKELEQILGENK